MNTYRISISRFAKCLLAKAKYFPDQIKCAFLDMLPELSVHLIIKRIKTEYLNKIYVSIRTCQITPDVVEN
jgi:hypothetical protein